MRSGKSFTRVEMSNGWGTVRCDKCPHWYGFCNTRLEGLIVANNHERSVHKSESTAAAARLANYRRRHSAANSALN